MQKTEKEKFIEWLEAQRASGMVNFNPYIDKLALAEKFGGKVVWVTDTSDIPYQIVVYPENTNHAEVENYIYKSMNDFIEAAESARPVSRAMDMWGNMLDDAHPDFISRAERLRHAKLCNLMFETSSTMNIRSAYEDEFVVQGILPVQDPERYAMMSSFIHTLSDEDIKNVVD